MKQCSKCKVEKPFSDFYKSKRKLDGYAYSCKQCSDIANKNTRKKDVAKYNKYRNNFKQKVNDLANQYKVSRGCACCGENSHPSVLELHHLDPLEKENDPSVLRTSWERWLTEAQKCVILCANCHRKVHAGILEILPL